MLIYLTLLLFRKLREIPVLQKLNWAKSYPAQVFHKLLQHVSMRKSQPVLNVGGRKDGLKCSKTVATLTH